MPRSRVPPSDFVRCAPPFANLTRPFRPTDLVCEPVRRGSDPMSCRFGTHPFPIMPRFPFGGIPRDFAIPLTFLTASKHSNLL